MAKKGKKNKPTPENMPIIHPHAAGIDVGAEEHWVCVPADRDAQPIQKFSAFTCDSPPYTFFLLNGDIELHRNW